MREARLVGLSQDGKQLILALAETGEEFAVPVDDRLRAALRGDRARLGQLEIQMESALRPRDIQARIRAGESPEAVAAVAQMPMERVMAFAGPVLAERDHVASLAQRASVRRRGGGDAPTRNLGAWVTERLRIRGVDPASAEWDAWRREDGRWAVRVSYFAEGSDEKVAMFAYDAPGRYAVPDDDEARWLVGEQVQVIAPQPTSERRLTAVADFDLSLAPDHGADSYEAGFEDTISLPRGRAAQADRDANRDTGRGFGRDPEYGTARDVERSARRVHSVPSPDDEPTLIDVPIEPPPTLRPAVRAVERQAQFPVEAPPLSPEERAAAPENRFTERRMPPPDSRRPEPRQPEHYQPRQPEPYERAAREAAAREAERESAARRAEQHEQTIRRTEHRESPFRQDESDSGRDEQRQSSSRQDEQYESSSGRADQREPASREARQSSSRQGEQHEAGSRQADQDEAASRDAQRFESRGAEQHESTSRETARGESASRRSEQFESASERADQRESASRQAERDEPASRQGERRESASRDTEQRGSASRPSERHESEARASEARRAEPSTRDERRDEQAAPPRMTRQEEAQQELARRERVRQEQAREEQEQERQEASRPAVPRPSAPRPADPRPNAPKPSDPRRQQPAVSAPAAEVAEPAAAAPAPEEKKKPAKRASKRASVPSWDEIMFGKKAD